MPTLRRPAHEAREAVSAAATRPVMLATLEAPFDPDAAEFAIETAVEGGAPLLLVNVVELLPGPCSMGLGYDSLPEEDDVAASLLAPAVLARSLGVAVERLRVKSPHPTDALVELAAERGVGLLVFGPDRSRVRQRHYRRTAKAIRERCPCLVWLPD
jgi:nucleotide-binding universal stress UspA family protein